MTQATSERFRVDSPGFLAFHLARLFEQRLDERLRAHQVTAAQWRALLVLWAAGEATQSEIARHLSVSQPTVANTLARMVQCGLASRRGDPANRRRVLFRPTARAWKLQPVLIGEAEAVNARAVDGLPADQRAAAIGILRALCDALEQS